MEIEGGRRRGKEKEKEKRKEKLKLKFGSLPQAFIRSVPHSSPSV
jgi:hypothetical protein